VVIAIIGILSSVVLASLNSARGKAVNAAVKSGLSNMRAQAQIYYDDNNQSYLNVCTATSGIATMLDNASTTGGNGTVCKDSTDAWSAAAGLKVAEDTNNAWCVGNSGASKAISSINDIATSTDCQ
jgi:type II secretory pathway pseudopilin PulG